MLHVDDLRTNEKKQLDKTMKIKPDKKFSFLLSVLYWLQVIQVVTFDEFTYVNIVTIKPLKERVCKVIWKSEKRKKMKKFFLLLVMIVFAAAVGWSKTTTTTTNNDYATTTASLEFLQDWPPPPLIDFNNNESLCMTAVAVKMHVHPPILNSTSFTASDNANIINDEKKLPAMESVKALPSQNTRDAKNNANYANVNEEKGYQLIFQDLA